jgi:hypothetical protein
MTEYHCYFGTRNRLCKKIDVDATDDALAIIEAERIWSTQSKTRSKSGVAIA